MRTRCAGSYGDAPHQHEAPCPVCDRKLCVVGGSIGVGWGRLRFPRHNAPLSSRGLTPGEREVVQDMVRTAKPVTVR